MQKFATYTCFIVALLAVVSGCEEKGVKVTKAEYGEKWPFTVDEGYLDCLGNHEVIFKVGRRQYALSGEAGATQKYLEVDLIWKEDPKMKGTKMLIAPIIERGEKLCK